MCVVGEKDERNAVRPWQIHGRGPEKLDAGTRQRRFQDAVSQHPRRTLECRWCSALAGTPRGAGAETLRFAAQENVSPRVLRHAAAMELLQAGVDRAVIALWLGHESVETTQIYLDADLALKEQALAKTNPVKGAPKRFQPDDELLTFLKQL